jgi:hypothetical protein
MVMAWSLRLFVSGNPNKPESNHDRLYPAAAVDTPGKRTLRSIALRSASGLPTPNAAKTASYTTSGDASSGDYLLLANCSVGREDKNLWLYRLDKTKGIELLYAIDLKDDLTRPQAFNFDADLIASASGLRFFASTEEGLLWAGVVQASKLVPTRTAFVASDGGALIDLPADGSAVLAAARQLFLFSPSP